MFYPKVEENSNSVSFIQTFYGYNHNYRINNGEFYDVLNMSSDAFPLLAPRSKRNLMIDMQTQYDYRQQERARSGETDEADHVHTVRGILLTADETLSYLEDNTFHYGTKTLDISEFMPDSEDLKSEQTLLRFGSYVLIFPAKVWINPNTKSMEAGRMEAELYGNTGTRVTLTICDYEGNSINAESSLTEPKDPEEGAYWLCTDSNKAGLYLYNGSTSSWEPVATTYLKLTVPGADFENTFEQYDAINMNLPRDLADDLNEGSIIQVLGADYVVITGLLKNGTTAAQMQDEGWIFHAERKLPDLDYICINQNRLWGCHYGTDLRGNVVNEIYASKQGDFKNWYCYEGLATDSYAISIGADGEWTGAISYNGYPTFFKENAIFRIYGNTPSNYQLSTIDCRGVQKGSSKSLAIVNEELIYKSATDVCVFDGSYPTSISLNLGRDTTYYAAVGSGCLGKYYLEAEDALGHKFYFVYDIEHNMWEREDAIGLLQFSTTLNGTIYCMTSTKIYAISAGDSYIGLSTRYAKDKEIRTFGEQYVEWYAETGDMGYEMPEIKEIVSFTLRANISAHSKILLAISTDDGPYNKPTELRGEGKTLSYKIMANGIRCDHFRVKLSGIGDVRIISLAIEVNPEGENNE